MGLKSTAYVPKGKTVPMADVGVNDALVLATADFGIAIGAGKDDALKSTRIALLRNVPAVVRAITLWASRHCEKMVQNLLRASVYGDSPMAAGMFIPLTIDPPMSVGAIAMNLSMIIAAIHHIIDVFDPTS